MDTRFLDAVQSKLQEQRAVLDANADQLRGELAAYDAQLGRIDAALAALSGTATPQAAAKASKAAKAEKRRHVAPAANKAQVVALIAEELALHHVVNADDLKARIEQKLVAAGHNRMGYSLRFKEAAADSQFVHSSDGIRMETETPRSVHKPAATNSISPSHGIDSSSSVHTTTPTTLTVTDKY